MTGFNRRTLIDLLPRAALALAAVVLFAPTAARADCATHIPSFSGFELPFAEAHDGSRHAGEQSSTPASEAPKPCSGPSCHKHDPLPYSPMPAPAPVPSGGGEEWGCIAAFQLLLSSPLGGLIRDDACVHGVRRIADVFHPPRTSSRPI